MDEQRTERAAVAAAPQQRQTVLWIIAILLAVIATALILKSPAPWGVQPALGDTPMMGGRGIYAFTGQIDKNRYGLFMMDVDTHNLWCYEYLPGTRRLRLVAARSFSWDRYLEDYMCEDETKPEAIRLMLDRQSSIKNRVSRGGVAPAKSPAALGSAMDGEPPLERDSAMPTTAEDQDR